MGFFRSLANLDQPKRNQRQHVSDLEHWLIHGDSGTSFRDSSDVNETTALTSSAVWSAVLQLGSTIGALPLSLNQKVAPGKTVTLDDNNVHFLMHLQPNPEMTSMIAREAMVGQLLLYGVSYAEKELDRSGNIKAIWPLLSSEMKTIRRDGQLFYRHTPSDGGKITFLPRERILHIPYLTTNGLANYSPIEINKEAIALSLELEKYASLFFQNNAKPAAVIEIPGGLSEKAAKNFKKSWNQQTEGLDNAHRTAILEEGIKLHEYGSTPANSQSIEQREFQLDEVARVFNLPPHMLKNLKRATYSNIEEQMREVVIFTLNQLVVRMEQNYTVQLLSERDYRENKIFFKHNLSGLLRGDTKARWDAYAQAFNMGVYSPNTILQLEDMNTYEGGDDRYIQLNMQKVQDVGFDLGNNNSNSDKDTKNDKSNDNKNSKSNIGLHSNEVRQLQSNVGKMLDNMRASYESLFVSSFSRVVSAEIKGLRKELKLLDENRNIVSYMDYVRDFYETKISVLIKRALWPTFQTFMDNVNINVGSVLGSGTDITQHSKDFVKRFLDDFVVMYTGKAEAEINALIRDLPDDVVAADAVGKRLDEWEERKANKNARRWRNRSMNAMALVKYEDSGFVRFRWRTVGENCPFCNNLNGTIVGVRGNFVNKNEVLSGEETLKDGTKITRYMTIKNFRKHPPLHDGCDCTVVPEA